MIKKEPYGISGARIVRGEDRPFVAEVIATYDPPEMIKFCQNCPKEDCEGKCPYKFKLLIEKVAQMILYGWRPVAIAVELGISKGTVERVVRTARKEGLLG